MKEPLKDKLRVVNCYHTRKYKEGDEKLGQKDGQTTVYAQLESLKSAVDWLKNEVTKQYYNFRDKDAIVKDVNVIALIDEAFPDLK